jgi:hypothetical protein
MPTIGARIEFLAAPTRAGGTSGESKKKPSPSMGEGWVRVVPYF